MLDTAKTPVTWEDTKAWIGCTLSVSEGRGG